MHAATTSQLPARKPTLPRAWASQGDLPDRPKDRKSLLPDPQSTATPPVNHHEGATTKRAFQHSTGGSGSGSGCVSLCVSVSVSVWLLATQTRQHGHRPIQNLVPEQNGSQPTAATAEGVGPTVRGDCAQWSVYLVRS